MIDEEFYKLFPSLKDKVEDHIFYIELNKDFAGDSLIDKQMAKEIIMKWHQRTAQTGEFIENLLKELGLE